MLEQTKDLETFRLIECIDAKEYRNEGHNIKEKLIKCLKPLKNGKQTLMQLSSSTKTRR